MERRTGIKRTLGGALLLALGAACDSAPAAAPPTCIEDQCDSVGSKEDLLAALRGHDDPVAAFLRANTTPRGTLIGDYRTVLDGVGAETGCDASGEQSFVVLTNNALIPKIVFARCTDDPATASQFFMAMPALRDVGSAVDVDRQILHLSAWDPTAGAYRTYSTRPNADGEMGVNVSPHFCLGCHGGPHKLGFWQPLMNEMTNPWSEWNAEPGFPSQLFDELLDPEIAKGSTYREITAPTLLDSASNLEPLVRAGIDRVVGSRVKAREEAADLEGALALLRPLFCDETVNFVSEIHDSGELRASAAFDLALPTLFAAAGDYSWPWLSTTKLHLPARRADDVALTLIPTRGESTVAMELSLVTRQALSPLQVLRVRALDWSHPVASDFRCNLFLTGSERVRAGAFGDLDGATIADLLPAVYDELMVLDVDGQRISLAPPPGKDVVAFADADAAEVEASLAGKDLGGLGATLDELGTAIQTHVDQIARESLASSRQALACKIKSEYTITPIYPDLSCD